MYCSVCGTEISNGENYCPRCGAPAGQRTPHVAPPITNGVADPEVLFKSTESKIFGAISSFVIGTGMIGGAVYGVVALSGYTKWVIVGSVFTFLGGVGCLIKGGGLVSRLAAQRKGKEQNDYV